MLFSTLHSHRSWFSTAPYLSEHYVLFCLFLRSINAKPSSVSPKQHVCGCFRELVAHFMLFSFLCISRRRPCSRMMSARQDRSSVKAPHTTISIYSIKETPADIFLNIYICILQGILLLYPCSTKQNVFPSTEYTVRRAQPECKANE